MTDSTSDLDEIVLPKGVITSVIVSVVAALILFGATFAAYRYANSKPGTIILPGGITYLGPTDTPKPTTPPSASDFNKFTADQTIPTSKWKGKIYPYSFQYPNTMSPGFFPDDPYDSTTIFWKDTNPGENIFLRIENLKNNADAEKLIGLPLKDYAAWWGKQYIWINIENYSEFTNSQGLKGLWVKFQDASGNSSGDNYFFNVPQRKDLVIWMASRSIETNTFNRIVDSLSWE